MCIKRDVINKSWLVLNISGQGYAYPARGLFLYTNLDNQAGVSDFKSNDINKYSATVVNTTFTGNTGVVNYALGFDETNGYVNFDDPSGDSLDPQYVTVACWVNPDSIGSSSYCH